jgi:hypothetical protein
MHLTSALSVLILSMEKDGMPVTNIASLQRWNVSRLALRCWISLFRYCVPPMLGFFGVLRPEGGGL